MRINKPVSNCSWVLRKASYSISSDRPSRSLLEFSLRSNCRCRSGLANTRPSHGGRCKPALNSPDWSGILFFALKAKKIQRKAGRPLVSAGYCAPKYPWSELHLGFEESKGSISFDRQSRSLLKFSLRSNHRRRSGLANYRPSHGGRCKPMLNSPDWSGILFCVKSKKDTAKSRTAFNLSGLLRSQHPWSELHLGFEESKGSVYFDRPSRSLLKFPHLYAIRHPGLDLGSKQARCWIGVKHDDFLPASLQCQCRICLQMKKAS